MDQELRDILDKIDAYLYGNGSDISWKDREKSRALWAILSALRGPDVDCQELKAATTAVIRATAFPKTAFVSHSRGGRVQAAMNEDSSEQLYTRQKEMKSSHFLIHAREAFEVLGLEWNEDNSKPKQAEGEKNNEENSGKN